MSDLEQTLGSIMPGSPYYEDKTDYRAFRYQQCDGCHGDFESHLLTKHVHKTTESRYCPECIKED